MAQTIKLRRSSTEGKVPTTAQLALGELAINTYDGRIFFEKNDGSATIEHIVTTDSITTGSITITGTTQTGTLTTTNRIDKQYLDDEVLNTSLNAATGSYLTSTGSVDYSDLTSVPAGILSSSAITITTAAQPNITSLGTLTTLTVDDITLNGSTISDSGDLTLDIGGDLNIDVDGTDIILKDGGTAFGRFKRDSSDFIIKSEANNEDIILRGQDGGATIDALTLDMSEAGAATFGGGIADAGTISAGTWNGGVIDKTYLDDEVLNTSLNSATGSYLTAHPNISAGSNISQNNSNGTVLQDLTITLDSNGHVTTATAGTVNLDGRYYTETESDTLFTKKLGQGVVSGSSQVISMLSSLNSFTASNANTSLNAATSSYLTTVDISSDTNLAVSDTSEVNMILSGDTLSAELIGGVVSGSSQITNIANSQLAGSIANSKLSNSAITISGTSVSLGGSISDETLFGGTGVVSGSSQVVTAATVKSALNGNLGTLTLGDSNDTVSIPGNLSVEGTRTFIDSTTLQIGDNIIELNGSGTNDGGIYVRDAEASTTTTGSLIWNTGDDKWTAGPKGSEDDVVLATATQTLTNKTINGSQLVDDSVTNAKLDNSSVSFGGVSVALGSSDSTPAFNLADATGYQTSNLSGTITNSQLAGSIANGKLSNSAITISGTSVSLGGSITDETLFGGVGVVTGSAQVAHDSTNGFVANEHIDHSGVSISAGGGLTGGGTIQSTRTLAVDYSTNSDNVVAGASTGTPTNSSTLLFADTGGVNKVALNSLNISLLNNNSGFGTGSVTNVTVGTGLDVSTGTTAPNITLDLSELTDMTADVVGSADELILLDNGAERRKQINEIKLSQFNNDSGFTSNTGDITGVTAGDGLTGGGSSGAVTINLGVGTGLTVDSDQVELDLSDLPDMTQSWTNGSDEFIVLDGGVQKRKLSSEIFGSNAFTSTTIGTTSNALTDGTGIADFSFDGSGTATISTDDSAIVHDNLSGFVANEHIDHSGVSITAGTGLNGGGNITTTRTLNVDSDYKNTSLNTFTSSFSSFGLTLIDDANASTARSTLGVDAAGTDNSTDVTLGGSYDYITISGQTITRNQIDLTTDVTGVLPSANLDSDTAHLSGTQTFSGAKTFTGDSKFTGQSQFQIMGDNNAIFLSSSIESSAYNPANDDGYLYIGGYQSGNSSDLGLVFDYNDTKLNVKGLEIVTSNTIDMNGTTQSTSKTTGTLQVAGGVGIAKTLNVGEDVVAYASSDERYKDLITPIQNPNEKIKLLSGNTFVWNDKHEVFKGKKDIGVIAQEVEKVLPEIVETRDNGYKAVKYEKIVALLIESNKELIKRVEELESKIK